MNPNHLNQIDAYLRNELSSKELSAFEQAMNADPSLNEHVKFEESVKEGLSQYRKAELKARLDAIEVVPAWYGMGRIGSATVRTMAGVLGAAVIGVVGYMSFAVEHDTAIVREPTSAFYPIDAPFLMPVKEIIIQEKEEETIPVILQETSSNSIQAIVNTESHASVDEPMRKEVTEPKDFMVQVVVPKPDEMISGESFVSPEAEMPDWSVNDAMSLKEAIEIDVETIERKGELLKYKYFDGKLFLYGDFREHPYEILEINSPSSRKLYLFHNSKYYSIFVTDKVEELDPIVDRKLLEELLIVRSNKL